TLASDLLPAEGPDRERLSGVENPRRRIRRFASFPHHVDVLMLALLRLGVVVVEVEGVGFGSIQKIHDCSILPGALGETVGISDFRRGCRRRGDFGRGSRRGRFRCQSGRENERRDHFGSLRARMTTPAASGPGFMNETRIFPSASRKNWAGTLQATIS